MNANRCEPLLELVVWIKQTGLVISCVWLYFLPRRRFGGGGEAMDANFDVMNVSLGSCGHVVPQAALGTFGTYYVALRCRAAR